uniref:Uncharacterized protein n=1 Tax=Plectus sambesii TaxID=2011161 RepID=A0A914XLE2_9BILA
MAHSGLLVAENANKPSRRPPGCAWVPRKTDDGPSPAKGRCVLEVDGASSAEINLRAQSITAHRRKLADFLAYRSHRSPLSARPAHAN